MAPEPESTRGTGMSHCVFIGNWTSDVRGMDVDGVIQSRCGAPPRNIHAKKEALKVVLSNAEQVQSVLDGGDFEVAVQISKQNTEGDRELRVRPWGADAGGTSIAASSEPSSGSESGIVCPETPVEKVAEILAPPVLPEPLGDVVLAVDALETDTQSAISFLRGRIELARAEIRGEQKRPGLPPGLSDVVGPTSPYTAAHALRLARVPSRDDKHRSVSRAPSQPLRPRGGEDSTPMEVCEQRGRRAHSRPKAGNAKDVGASAAAAPAARPLLPALAPRSLLPGLAAAAPASRSLLPGLAVTPPQKAAPSTPRSSDIRWSDVTAKTCVTLGDWSPRSTEKRAVKNPYQFHSGDYEPTMLNTWGKTHPAQTKMQSLVWPALAREIDVVAIDETKSGSHLDFLPPLLLKFYQRGIKRGREYKQRDPVACIIAPNFETIAAVQRGHDELMGGKPEIQRDGAIQVTLLSIGGFCWSLDHSCGRRPWGIPLPRHLHGREAETFQWECSMNAGCDIVVCTSSSFIELSASGVLPTKSLEHLIVLEPNAAWNAESQLRSVMSRVASTVSISVFCDAWSPVV